jgi:hypothetical protein
MPDTPPNQRAYPQPDTQKPGLGFPLARLGAVFSLACGAVLDLGICRYAGKGQSELGLLRTLWDLVRPGDVLLADRLMCAWTEMVMLKQRGIDCVCRLTSHRAADFRRGRRLGEGDHIVKWLKPRKPRSVDRETYALLPGCLMIRECRVRVEQPGFRVKALIVATTLLEGDQFTKDDLATIYLSGALARGTGHEVAKTDHADGCPAVQDEHGRGAPGVGNRQPGRHPNHVSAVSNSRDRSPKPRPARPNGVLLRTRLATLTSDRSTRCRCLSPTLSLCTGRYTLSDLNNNPSRRLRALLGLRCLTSKTPHRGDHDRP